MAGQLETQINRFKVNEERLNTFVNVDGFYTTSSGVQVPTLLNVSRRIEASVENVSLAEQSASIEITRQTDLVIAASTSAQEEFLNEDSKINTLAKNTIADWQTAINTITQTEGVPALAVSTANNETQQSINDSVGAKWYQKVGGYPINYRVRLDNGDIVKNTIAGNTNDPNVDMTGWEYDPVNLKLNTIANSIKRTLTDVVYDQIIDVTWFGGRGDWDAETQTGTDNTAAVANAIAYFSTLGTRRQGGRRAIKFPIGNWKLSTIDIPQAIVFGLCFIGDDRNTSILWFDHTDARTAITSAVEQVEFQNLGIFGTLSESNSGDDTLWKQVGYRGEQYAKRPDIDVRFYNCSLLYFKEFSQILGRGCVFDSCIIGYIRTLLNIVCSTETLFTTAANNKLQTGMRHYVIQNCRFDVVSTTLTVSGTGTQREFINGIFINGNEFTSCDALIKTQVGSTLRRPIISGINAQSSFATGIIQAHNIVGGGISTGAINRLADDAINPSVVADTIYSVVKNTGYLSNFKIFSLDVRGIYSSIVEVGAASKDVKIIGCDFQDAWTFAKSTTKVVFDSATPCAGLWIKDNTFESKVTTGVFRYYNDVQNGNTKTYIKDNKSNFNFTDQRFSYTPQLLVDGVATSVVASTAHGRYYYDDTFVYADVILTVTPTETSGSLAVSLPPIAAIAENSTASGNYAGSGQVNRTLGFSASGYVFAPIVINPSNQQAELYKTKDMVTERVTVTDRAGVTNLIVSLKYRYK